MLEEAGENLLHARVESFLVRRARVPGRNRLGPRRELRVLRNETELLLLFERDLALAVPAVIERPLVFVGPLLVHVMRGVTGARRKVDEERLVGCGGLLLPDPTDRPLGDRFGEVPLRVVVRHLDRGGVLEERRKPLVRFATLEPVEVAETLAGRPAIVGAARAKFVIWRVVPLAEGGGGVLVLPEYLRDARRFPRPLPVVP